MIDEADRDGDGEVSLEEFERIMRVTLPCLVDLPTICLSDFLILLLKAHSTYSFYCSKFNLLKRSSFSLLNFTEQGANSLAYGEPVYRQPYIYSKLGSSNIVSCGCRRPRCSESTLSKPCDP